MPTTTSCCVRSPARIDDSVKPLGVEGVDYVVGDMTDSAGDRSG